MSKFNDLIGGETPVLVDFHALWCGPCKTIAPILKEVKSELKDKVKVIKIDIDKNEKAAIHFGVRGVPTLILFQKGKQIWRQSGVIPKSELLKIIQPLIS